MSKQLTINNSLVEINEASLQVRTLNFNSASDNRPTIVFLHDSLGCITLWRDFPQLVAEQTTCNVLIYDRQGYGNSSAFGAYPRTKAYLENEADVLIEVLAKCNIDQPILFGHSDGGSIGIIAAGKYPEMISGVMVEGVHVFVEEETLAGIRKAIDVYASTNLKEKLTKYHGAKTEALFRAWTETWIADWYRDWNIEHFLPAIQCPVLVIQGEKDEYGTDAQVNSIVSKAEGKSLKLLIPEIGHSPHKEAPEAVLKATVDFVKMIIANSL